MAASPSLAGQTRQRAPAWGFWLGPTAGAELAVVRAAVEGQCELAEHATVAGAIAEAGVAGRWPDLVLLAADRPGRWPPEAVATVVRQWPLATVVGVATSLGEGRRRSGPALTGIEEVAWHDLPGRLECWLAA
ncbi:hypothetical protein EBR56_11735, partial [bacterium]|nr:hypothetical protein [bacterium]